MGVIVAAGLLIKVNFNILYICLLFMAAILKIAAILNLKDRSRQNLDKNTKSFIYIKFCVSGIKADMASAILEIFMYRMAAILKKSRHIEF